MIEIETREGVDLDALQEAYVLLTEPAGMTEALRKRIDAAQRMVVLSLPALIAELRAARTPAQTQTFKDGFAAVETALLIDELRGDQHADVSLCQDNRVMVSAGWTGMIYRGFSGATLLDSLRAATAARSQAALKEPS